jgi:hypothetical protein
MVAVLSACGSSGESDDDDASDAGSDGLSAEEQAFVDAWSASLQDSEEGFSVERPADADCMAEAMMAEVGIEPFEDAGVTPDDIGTDAAPGELLGDGVISDEQADAILMTWSEDCTDLAALMGDAAASEFGADAEGAQCLSEGLETEGLIVDLLRPSFTQESDEPDPTTQATFFELFDECGVLVVSLANGLSADGSMTEAQAMCVAQAVVDEVGAAPLIEMSDDDASEADEQALNQAWLQAALSCGVDASSFGGG